MIHISYFEHTVVVASDFKNCMVVNSEINITSVFLSLGFTYFALVKCQKRAIMSYATSVIYGLALYLKD